MRSRATLSRAAFGALGALLGVAAPAIAGGAAPAPTPTPGWLQAETVPVPASGGTVSPNYPAVGLLPNGQVIAVAVLPGGVADLAVRSTTTGRWTRTAAGLTADAGTYIRPRLEVAATGHVVAVWQTPGGLTSATRGTDGSWSAPEVVSLGGATLSDLAVNRSGGGVIVYNQGTALRSRVRTGPSGPWSTEGLIALGPNVGQGVAAVADSGAIDGLYFNGPGNPPVTTAGSLATNTWGGGTDFPGYVPGQSAGRLHIRPDGLGGGFAFGLRSNCEPHAAVRDAGSAIWFTVAVTLPFPACGDAGFNDIAFDMNRAGRALLAGSIDEGPGPDSFLAAARSAGTPLTGFGPTAFRFPVGDTDSRHTIGAPVVGVIPSGLGIVGMTESPGEEETGRNAVAVSNITAAGVVRNGFVTSSRAHSNHVISVETVTPPATPPLVSDSLNRVNNAVLVWRASTLNAASNSIRIALRPGAGLRLLGVTRRNSAGRIAARIVLNQPARATVTFTTPSGRRIGRVVRNLNAGPTVVSLPGASARALSLFRVRVDVVNGGTKATRRG